MSAALAAAIVLATAAVGAALLLDHHELRAHARRWLDAGHPVKVSVNVSALELAQPDFPDAVEASLAAQQRLLG